MSRVEFDTRTRIEAAEYDPEGFALGFQLGKVAVERNYEGQGYNYKDIPQARRFFGTVIALGYDIGVHVGSAEVDFLKESEVKEVERV